ncbi:MAG: hypothetical protein L0Y78_09925 [candidate division NC10 bacterium]|nr:hypothetical protein [candidate division NC10 bacterium]
MARPAMGTDLLNKLSGSEEAKTRLKVILETVAGRMGIEQASTELGISRSRFFELRDQVLQAAMSDLEPKPRGRPVKPADAEALQRRVQEIEAEGERMLTELRIANLREEIRLVFPQYVVDGDEASATAEKKTPQRRNQRKRQRRRQGR